ncbi:uncharacterized protein LOC125673453 isoform X2 [Ostrea edulis]|uniref:uncharacterized protein LOC125673453 isoform X2 n=1 Tax=Ostrea edulis TaxID=37623 RepID=UPI0024AEBE08|nr:uncharacterized protein LOC125673453 isoform X2 [Ostrea edulis]
MHLSINHQYSTTSVRKYQNYLHQVHVPYYMPRLHWCSIWNLHLDYIFQMRGCSTLKLSNCLRKMKLAMYLVLVLLLHCLFDKGEGKAKGKKKHCCGFWSGWDCRCRSDRDLSELANAPMEKGKRMGEMLSPTEMDEEDVH